MMRVPVQVKSSSIEGLGVFALSSIRAGTLLWQLDPDLDRLLSAHAVNVATGLTAEYLSRYAYYDPAHQLFILCVDDARFMNHSERPNVSDTIHDRCHALRDIAAGEELTCNYHSLDPRPMQFEPR